MDHGNGDGSHDVQKMSPVGIVHQNQIQVAESHFISRVLVPGSHPTLLENLDPLHQASDLHQGQK